MPRILAKRFISPIVAGPDRQGPPTEAQITDSEQDIVLFDWGDRLGLLDFTGDQYFSWIRGRRVLVRGERGEIENDTIRYLKDFSTPISLDLRRDTTGANANLEGFCLRGIQVGDEWVYRNPFAPASLSDDEIAIASCLVKMDQYVRTGQEFYSLAEACQDHYLSLICEKAVNDEGWVDTPPQHWAD